MHSSSSSSGEGFFTAIVVISVVVLLIMYHFSTPTLQKKYHPEQKVSPSTISEFRAIHYPRRKDESIRTWHARLPPPMKTNDFDDETETGTGTGTDTDIEKRETRQDSLHIGIIPDGNRRWGRNHQQNYVQAIRTTMKKLHDIAFSRQSRVGSITVYLASVLNLLQRNPIDVDFSMRCVKEMWKQLRQESTNEKLQSIFVVWVGDRSFYPDWFLREVVADIEAYTCQKQEEASLCLYLLFGYDPATKTMSRPTAHGQIVEQPFLDIVIRTGNDFRLSGFVPYHASYAELFFLDKYAPDLDQNDVVDCLERYDKRRKTHGR
jgi:undecaprenyl diphosphate synthase